MTVVEVYKNDEWENEPLFVASFNFLPRVGETISKDAGGYFTYYEVIEVWHREEPNTGAFRACLGVKLND